jgi:peptide-methionine (S)-S-oxide reductase
MEYIKQVRRWLLYSGLAVALAGGLAIILGMMPGRASAEVTVAETASPPPGKEVATFAAGCFWSMEAIFKQLKGVEKVVPGYAGGRMPHPSYEQVETGATGYAESVNITFDPKVISYRDLLQVLLTVRDPTTRDQQGPDQGPQYRSVIFYRNAAQKQAAEEAIREVTAAHIWKNPIVTAVQPFTTFYRAEDYHLDYYRRHPYEPYCAFVIAPEIADFRAKFQSKLKP